MASASQKRHHPRAELYRNPRNTLGPGHRGTSGLLDRYVPGPLSSKATETRRYSLEGRMQHEGGGCVMLRAHLSDSRRPCLNFWISATLLTPLE